MTINVPTTLQYHKAMPISKLSRSVMINAPAEYVWTTLKAFNGNEKFNPLVTSSSLEGDGVGCKRVCYVTVDGGKTESETIEVFTSLNEDDRTMAYRVLSAPNTPFEGLVNDVSVRQGEGADRCTVEFTGSFEAEDEKSRTEMNKILQSTYEGILNGLKKMHET